MLHESGFFFFHCKIFSDIHYSNPNLLFLKIPAMGSHWKPGSFCPNQTDPTVNHGDLDSAVCEGCGKLNPQPSENRRSQRPFHVPPGREVIEITSSPPRTYSTPPPPRPAPTIPVKLEDSKQPYIRRGIGEEGRKASIEKHPNKKATPLYTPEERLKITVCAVRQNDDGVWKTFDNGQLLPYV